MHQEESYHEQDVNLEHRRILRQRSRMAETSEQQTYSLDPHPQQDVSGLPPRPPGWIKLQQSVSRESADDKRECPGESCRCNIMSTLICK